MQYDTYLMAFARDVSPMVSPELTAFLRRRLASEGITSFARGMGETYDAMFRSLSNGIESLPDGYIPRCSVEFKDFPKLLDFFGMFSKLELSHADIQPDWDSFLSRNREVSNYQGASWEDILPLPPGFKKWISRMLGSVPNLLVCKHGPGATAEKLTGWDKWLPILEDREVCKTIRMVDVPKDFKTRRLIGIEPVRHQFIQQGVAHALRNTRYFRAYINLIDQDLHAKRACSPEYTTIDLKDASDSIPLSLVEYLLPPDWYRLLASYSSGYCVLPNGSTHRLGMLATMGNGFCFEVETLIFHLVASLLPSDNLTSLMFSSSCTFVYGDDIVLRRAFLPEFEHFCARSGWTVSDKKTARTSQFKETVGYWIVDGIPRKRFLPSLVGNSAVITVEREDKLSLATRAQLSGYRTLASAISAGCKILLRWDENFQRWEFRSQRTVSAKRPLSITEEIRYYAYWKLGLSDQHDEDCTHSVRETHWVPCDAVGFLEGLYDPRPPHAESVSHSTWIML